MGLVWPSIDLMKGRAVRLPRGEQGLVVDVGDPLAVAEFFAAAGRAHVVDLDGAFAGGPRQTAIVAAIVQRLPQVQAGGGVRKVDHVKALLDVGVERVVIGTQAFSEPSFLDACIERFGPDRIVVAADIKDGRVATKGWTATLPLAPAEAAVRLVTAGVHRVVVTAVSRNATMEGPDTAAMDVFQEAGLAVLASGGIGSLDDLRKTLPYAGTIVGSGFYTNRFTLSQAMAVLERAAS